MADVEGRSVEHWHWGEVPCMDPKSQDWQVCHSEDLRNLQSISYQNWYFFWIIFFGLVERSKVTKFQLEKLYGKSSDAKAFIESLCKGQAGTPHPQARWLVLDFNSPCSCSVWQAPDNPKARMYKVLKEVVEEDSQGKKSESTVTYWHSCMVILPKPFLHSIVGSHNP